MKRVVVTGIGVASPLGLGAGAYWENLLSGRCAVGRISRFDPGGLPSQVGGEVPAYKIGDYVPKSYRKATKVMARDIELAVIAADDAFKSSGLQSKATTDTPNFQALRFGCNIGAGLINPDLTELALAFHEAREGNQLNLKKWGAEGINHLTPLWLLKYLPNMLACHVTIIHELKGPSNTITCSDASSHLAIGEAFRTIQRGDADFAICGGGESKINPMALLRQCLVKRVNEECNDSPATAVRPFDRAAKGTAVGEGAGLLILEEREHALSRKANILAELVGFGASQDTHRIAEPSPDGKSYGQAIQKALADANLSPDKVDLLIPHGLGIAAHDRAELNGLRISLGEHLRKVYFAPLKAQTGMMAAGGGTEVVAAIMALNSGKVPPAINTQNIIEDEKLNVAAEARSADLNIAVSSVYSLGGQNAALVFRRTGND